jgi:RimJ/RimL family protein N-acetyltransferase
VAANSIPVLETERLRLRPFQATDLDAQAQMLGDSQVVRFLGGRASTREEAWRKMLTGPGMWQFMGFGYWAVERKEDGAYIGQTGFADFKRDLKPSIEGLPEMGWLFASHAHGKGYAREAIAAGLDWADEALQGQDVVAIINPDNLPSIRVAEKTGFTERMEAMYGEEPILLFRRPSRA